MNQAPNQTIDDRIANAIKSNDPIGNVKKIIVEQVQIASHKAQVSMRARICGSGESSVSFEKLFQVIEIP